MDGSPPKAQVSIRLPAPMLDCFDRIAAALERDRTWVILRALRQYLDEEGADVLNEAAALASLDRGEGLDFDAVQAEADAIITQARDKKRVKTG